jgi:membrane protein involved in colicin uptake
MAAPTQERRLELLALIAAAPESDQIDREWARTEQSRVLNRYAEAEKMISEAEAKTLAAKREAQAALDAAQVADRRAAEQQRFREEAERVAHTTKADLDTLRAREAKALAEAAAARDRTATALTQEREAQLALKRAPLGAGASTGEAARRQVPSSFVLSSAKGLLAGSGGSVSRFVTWADTPQGHDFWSGEEDRLRRGEGLSAEARDTIAGWVREAEGH